MRPAFSSTKQAAMFALLLLLTLLSPLMVSQRFLPPREQAYASAGWDYGPYPWIQKQVFNETNEIDIAFVGSSHILLGIDTPYVQQKLDAQLGRKSVVRTIAWGEAGFDAVYFITKDLLAHRRVNTIVFYDESGGAHPNPKAVSWFRYADNAESLAGLSLKDKSVFYFAAVAGMPRNLMTFLVPDLAEYVTNHAEDYFETHYHAPNPETRLGSVSGHLNYLDGQGKNSAFSAFNPQTGATPADVCLYNRQTATNFLFLNRSLAPWQAHFAQLFSLTAQQHKCRLVLLHLPVKTENNSPLIAESKCWPDFLPAPVTMIGIPGKRLFAGLGEGQMQQLYEDPFHFNENGQKYFTALITPALLRFYESQPAY